MNKHMQYVTWSGKNNDWDIDVKQWPGSNRIHTTSTGNHTLRSILQNLSHYKSWKQTDALPLDLTEGPGATSKNNKTISITTDTCFCHAHSTWTFPKEKIQQNWVWTFNTIISGICIFMALGFFPLTVLAPTPLSIE